jgi:hypothetical protein
MYDGIKQMLHCENLSGGEVKKATSRNNSKKSIQSKDCLEAMIR